MTDPLLDEHEIMQDLHLPVTSQSVARMQMAVVGVMCDLYDRKVTREEFVEMLGPCISLYGALAKLYMISNVRKAHQTNEGGVTGTMINTAVDAAENNVRSHVGGVREILSRLMQCPTSQDQVH